MNPGAIELQEIQVDKACQSMRCQCWTYNITDQFPIKSISEISGNMIVEVGPPHEGYTIETTVINKTINGKSKIISPDKVVIASLVFVDGVACGPCKLYDEMGILYFKGYLENGLRQGRGTEYDENRRIVFDGFFEKGKKRKIVPMDNFKQYWIEYDENDDIINIGQRDENGQLKGKCYFYRNNGEISRISEWDEGNELNVIKEFIGNKMIEYKNVTITLDRKELIKNFSLHIKPGEKVVGDISFAVDNINRKFWLTFYDRRYKKPLTKISVDNAYKKVSAKTKKKNDKVRTRKVNFKKQEDLFEID